MTEAAALALEHIGKRYGKRWVLRDCTFVIPSGAIAALVGPSAAGKSTCLRLAAGLTDPTVGQLTIFGDRVCGRLNPRAAVLSQSNPLYPRLTVSDTLKAGKALSGRWDQRRADAILQRLDLDMRQRVGSLSAGTRSQLALALALARRPDVLLLDEPLAALDPIMREHTLQTLMADAAEFGTTIVMTTHVMADLEGICDYLVVLRDGVTRLAGDVDELLAEHRHYVASTEATFFEPSAVITQRSGERQATVFARTTHPAPPDWAAEPVTLEQLVLGYLRP